MEVPPNAYCELGFRKGTDFGKPFAKEQNTLASTRGLAGANVDRKPVNPGFIGRANLIGAGQSERNIVDFTVFRAAKR